MWYRATKNGRLREVGRVAGGIVYSYNNYGNSGMGSLRWPWWSSTKDFLAASYRFEWFWSYTDEHGTKFIPASHSTVTRWRRLIELGDYESWEYGHSLAERQQKEQKRKWRSAELEAWSEGKRSLQALRKHLRQHDSPTPVLPPERISRV